MRASWFRPPDANKITRSELKLVHLRRLPIVPAPDCDRRAIAALSATLSAVLAGAAPPGTPSYADLYAALGNRVCQLYGLDAAERQLIASQPPGQLRGQPTTGI